MRMWLARWGGVTACLLVAAAMVGSAAGQTQAEMNAEAAQALEEADARLNEVYQQLLADHAEDAVFVKNLREAQRAWLKFAEWHVKSLYPVAEGEDPRFVYGSMYPLEVAAARTELIEVRTAQLEALAAGEEEGEDARESDDAEAEEDAREAGGER